MPHFTNNTHESIHEIGIADVFVRLVKHYEFVEKLTLKGSIPEKLQEHHKKPQGFILLDELIAEVHDHQPPGPDHLAQPGRIINIISRQIEAEIGQLV